MIEVFIFAMGVFLATWIGFFILAGVVVGVIYLMKMLAG